MSSDDIVERLRRVAPRSDSAKWPILGPLTDEAADEIERLRAEIDLLRRWKAESITLLKQWNQIADDVIARLDADNTLGLRLPDIVASELARLRTENAAFRSQFAFADEIREAFANWDGTDASLPEGWRRER